MPGSHPHLRLALQRSLDAGLPPPDFPRGRYQPGDEHSSPRNPTNAWTQPPQGEPAVHPGDPVKRRVVQTDGEVSLRTGVVGVLPMCDVVVRGS